MASKRKKPPVHSSIRKTLGYKPSDSDEDIYADWKERTSRVCKPCWELKYCPYGPLVEQSPSLPSLKADANEHVRYLEQCLATGLVGSKSTLDDSEKDYYERWLNDEEILLKQAIYQIRQDERLSAASQEKSDEEKIDAWIGPLPPIEIYRTDFDSIKTVDEEIRQEDFDENMWNEIQRVVATLRSKYQTALDTGSIDDRKPIEPVRRAWFQRVVDQHDPANHPDAMPQCFSEAECSIFGHVCPVFFAAEGITETEEERRIGRKQLTFETMMRIVRRDNYRCQHCNKQLEDNEVEFDHKIPVSKGGSSEEHNIRLTCFRCNRDKSNSYTP